MDHHVVPLGERTSDADEAALDDVGGEADPCLIGRGFAVGQRSPERHGDGRVNLDCGHLHCQLGRLSDDPRHQGRGERAGTRSWVKDAQRPRLR